MEFWHSEFAKQGIIVLLFAGAMWTGYKRLWQFTYIADDKIATIMGQMVTIREENANVIREKDKVIEEKDKVLQIVQETYRSQLRDKEEECDRISARLAKSEEFTDQLITRSIQATAILTEASRVVTEAKS